MVLNPLTCRASGVLLDELREVLGRDAELVGIEAYLSLLAVVLAHKLDKALNDRVLLSLLHILQIVELAQTTIVEYADKVLDNLKAEGVLAILGGVVENREKYLHCTLQLWR